MTMMLLTDLFGGTGLVAGAVFLLIFLAVAFIAFKLLKKTVKMAFRMAIVGIILAIAIAGSVSFWWLGSSKPAQSEHPHTSQTK